MQMSKLKEVIEKLEKWCQTNGHSTTEGHWAKTLEDLRQVDSETQSIGQVFQNSSDKNEYTNLFSR